MRLTGWIAVMIGVVALAGSSSGADDEYFVAFKEYKPGVTVLVERKGTVNMWMKLKELEGLGDQEMKMTYKTVYWEQARKKDEMGITQFRRGYGEARKSMADKNTVMAYEGKIVDIEKAGNQYLFSMDKQRLAGKDAEDLDMEFNKIKENRTLGGWDILARAKVKLNETWNLEPQRLIRDMEAFGMEFGSGKIQAVARLEKVYQRDNRPFGALLVHIEAPVRAIRQQAITMPLESGAKLVVQMTYDGCIDGTIHEASLKSLVQLNGTALVSPAKNKTFKIPIVIRGNDTQTIKERK